MQHFIVPALFDPWPDASPSLSLPALERLVARGDQTEGPADREAALFDLFGIPADQRAAAPICWLGLTGEAPPGWVLRVHPVHYRADRDRLLLFPLEEGDITAALAESCRQRFNEHFAGEGLELKIPAPGHWFLFTPRPVEAVFVPLREARGKNLYDSMPSGEQARFWRGLLNETQMLFHSLEAPVNGLWFEGGGRLPEPRGHRPADLEADGDCLARGLERLATTRTQGVRLALFRQLERARDRGDDDARLRALARLEKRIAAAMEAGEELVLEPCDGRRWRWRPAMRRRFWRRRRPLFSKV